MIRWNSFPGGVAFAAVAALGWMPWLLVAGPLLGLAGARVVYLIAVAAFYVAGLSSRRTRRLTAALGAVAAGVALAFIARSTNEVVLGLAGVIGIVRSGFLHRRAPAQAVALEVCLLGGGLVLARFLAGIAPPATAFAVWGFLLVQSFFFLGGGDRAGRVRASHVDPFEEAFRRATQLLGEKPRGLA
jgi:hypothetical protein